MNQEEFPLVRPKGGAQKVLGWCWESAGVFSRAASLILKSGDVYTQHCRWFTGTTLNTSDSQSKNPSLSLLFETLLIISRRKT